MMNPVQNHLCAKCGSPAEKQFSLKFGKTVKETSPTGQDKIHNITVGRETGYICNACIARERRRTVKNIILMFLIVSVIGIVAFIILSKEPGISIIAGISISVILTLISFTAALAGKPTGSYVLSEVHRKRLKDEGYNLITAGPRMDERTDTAEITALERGDTIPQSQQNGVVEDLPVGSCHICRKEVSEMYHFYYGTRKAIDIKKTPKQEVITSSYSIMGTHTGGVCNDCVKRRIIGFMMASFSGSAVSLLITILWIMASTDKQRDLLAFIAAGAAAIVFAVFAFNRLKALREHNYQEDGSKLLIKAEKQKFMLQGYDSFWTPGDFARLKQR